MHTILCRRRAQRHIVTCVLLHGKWANTATQLRTRTPSYVCDLARCQQCVKQNIQWKWKIIGIYSSFNRRLFKWRGSSLVAACNNWWKRIIETKIISFANLTVIDQWSLRSRRGWNKDADRRRERERSREREREERETQLSYQPKRWHEETSQTDNNCSDKRHSASRIIQIVWTQKSHNRTLNTHAHKERANSRVQLRKTDKTTILRSQVVKQIIWQQQQPAHGPIILGKNSRQCVSVWKPRENNKDHKIVVSRRRSNEREEQATHRGRLKGANTQKANYNATE